MITRCECGRHAVVLAKPKAKSCRRVKARQPVQMPGHYLCPGCYNRRANAERAAKLVARPGG